MTISRCIAFRLQPRATNSVASQSSSSGWVGPPPGCRSRWAWRRSRGRNGSCQSRLTITRAGQRMVGPRQPLGQGLAAARRGRARGGRMRPASAVAQDREEPRRHLLARVGEVPLAEQEDRRGRRGRCRSCRWHVGGVGGSRPWPASSSRLVSSVQTCARRPASWPPASPRASTVISLAFFLSRSSWNADRSSGSVSNALRTSAGSLASLSFSRVATIRLLDRVDLAS